ncbi:hypothetical protein QOZ80_4BG0359350 [Eleusine coracana subsp. coracana]|nr:hypothetical protein QOZ80_4BG0359350 [Eleusine coracana subsp. coracana]
MAEEAIGIAALPDDGLAGVLRVLPPRSLAVARCVCKAWRDIIDGRSLLLPHLLPRSVHGIFINYIDHQRAHLFSRPSSSFSRIDGLLRFMLNADPEEDIWWTVLDHCNGLLLCDTGGLYVCNPAMQRWTQLPQHTTKARYQRTSAYIAFDPVLSVHYEVFLIPDVPEEKPKPADPVVYRKAEQALDATSFSLEWLFSSPEDQASEEDQRHVEPPSTIEKDHDPCHLMKWPPSPWILKVFSSRNGQWEDRSFAREGQPAGTVEDMQLEKRTWHTQLYAVYNNGVLYVHCRGSFIARYVYMHSSQVQSGFHCQIIRTK